MVNLYPLKFKTIFKEKIWGGDKLRSLLNKNYAPLKNCGETWEISGVPGEESIISNGPLKGQSLPAILQTYKDLLVGNNIYNIFKDEFPLLIKFIDANDNLSIQVHPDDVLAMERHQSKGKTEMWYILQADKDAILNTGFNQALNEEKYLTHLQDKTLEEILNYEEVKEGDVFFLPAGRVHYIGKGICLAEIQQTSDITYRIYDFDRKDDKGNSRELHTDLARKAIDYTFHENYKSNYVAKINEPVKLVSCPYFTTNLINATDPISRNFKGIDSFIIYIVLEGYIEIQYNEDSIPAEKGECILIPASVKNIEISVNGFSKMLEVYIE